MILHATLICDHNPIHYSGIALFLGVFRTTSINSPYVAANELSLGHRLLNLRLGYSTRFRTNQHNFRLFFYITTFYDTRQSCLFLILGLMFFFILIHVIYLLAKYYFNAILILPPLDFISITNESPWHEYPKRNTNPVIYHLLFADVRDNISPHISLFTEGSKD